MRLKQIAFTTESTDHQYNYTSKTEDAFKRKCFPKSKSKRTAIKYRRRRLNTSNSWIKTIFMVSFAEHCKLWQRYFMFNNNITENLFSNKWTSDRKESIREEINTTNANNTNNHLKQIKRPNRIWMKSLPRFSVTSLFTLFVLICAETVLLSTMTNCAKTFYMHWNTSNSIFRIDNTDHIIDVNKGNLAFEFDQVHIICPVYEPGTFENETERYIIYNVSKVEYETCRITNADPRVIAVCDKPQKLMFFTITFRPFTPQPGGLEFLPGNDYYFISTSSKDDLYRRIGGRCSTNNMKVVFKVCCAQETKNKTIPLTEHRNVLDKVGNIGTSNVGGSNSDSSDEEFNVSMNVNHVQSSGHLNHHVNTIATNDRWNSGVGGAAGTGNNGMIPTSVIRINADTGNSNYNNRRINNNNNYGGGQRVTSINTEVDTFNRLPTHSNSINVLDNSIVGSNNNNIGVSSTHGNNNGGGGILMHGDHNNGVHVLSIGDYPNHGYRGQSGVRINNVPSSHYTNRDHIDDNFDKHSNEVVKNEELTYNSASTKNRLFIIDIFCAMYNAGNGVLKKLTKQITINDGTMKNVQFSKYINYSGLNIFAFKSSKMMFSNDILKITIILVTVTVLIGLVLICILTGLLNVNTKILWYHKKRIKYLKSFNIDSNAIDAITTTHTTTTTNNNNDNNNDICHYNKLPVNYNFKRKNIINIFNDKRIKSR